MERQLPIQVQTSKRKGFSLIECVIAIGLVAVLLTTFMAVFGPAQQNINRALGEEDANRLVSTLENEMAIYRDTDLAICEYTFSNGSGTTSTAFEKAFQWVRGSNNPESAVLIYQYQASSDTDAKNSDGTLKAVDTATVTNDSSVLGVDYITQTVARRLDNSDTSRFLRDELVPGVVVGNVYVARMTQLVRDEPNGLVVRFDTSDVSKAGSNEIYSPALLSGGTSVDSTEAGQFDEAYLTLKLELFQLGGNQLAFVSGGRTTGGTWNFESLGEPVLVQNIAVRR